MDMTLERAQSLYDACTLDEKMAVCALVWNKPSMCKREDHTEAGKELHDLILLWQFPYCVHIVREEFKEAADVLVRLSTAVGKVMDSDRVVDTPSSRDVLSDFIYFSKLFADFDKVERRQKGIA